VKTLLHFFEVYRKHSEEEIASRDNKIQQLQEEASKHEEKIDNIILEKEQMILEIKQDYENIVKNLQSSVKYRIQS
jgi:hypothetical protein